MAVHHNHWHPRTPLAPKQVHGSVCISVDWCIKDWDRARETALALNISLSTLVWRAITKYMDDNNLPQDWEQYAMEYGLEKSGPKHYKPDPAVQEFLGESDEE